MSPQVTIVLYLSVVGALLLYMAFLMLVDPLIRKPDAYTEQLHNVEEDEVAAHGPAPRAPPSPAQCPAGPQTPAFSSAGPALCAPR